MSRVYVAAKFQDRMTARCIMAHLRGKGHTITFDWTDSKYQNREETPEDAVACLNGVRDCEVFIGVFVKPYKYQGSLVELGVALGLKKKVHIIGDAIDSCIFY
ncbi:MAG: hypothetical protein ABIH68_02545, partial [bacterium]